MGRTMFGYSAKKIKKKADKRGIEPEAYLFYLSKNGGRSYTELAKWYRANI